MPGLVSEPELVVLIVPTPAVLGVKVTVTPTFPLRAIVVGENVPEIPETAGVIVAVVGPFPVKVKVTGTLVVPVLDASEEV